MCFRGRVKKYCMQCTDDVGPTDPRLLPIETVRCHAYMYSDQSRCPGVIETDQTLSTDEGIICQRCREAIVRNAERAGRENREREAGMSEQTPKAHVMMLLMILQRIDQAIPTAQMATIDPMVITDATAVEAPAATTMEEVVPTAICPTEQMVIMDRMVIMAQMVGRTARTVITDRIDRVATDMVAIIETVSAAAIWCEARYGGSYGDIKFVLKITTEGCSVVDGCGLCSETLYSTRG